MLARRLRVITDQTIVHDKDFRNFYLRSPIGRMTVSVEPDGRFVYVEVNNVIAANFDTTREKMIGRVSSDVFEKEFADQFDQFLSACLRTKKPVTFNALPRFPGGVRVQSFTFLPIADADGRVQFIDVMERPDAADSLQLQRERDDAITLLTSLFDASGLGIVVTDHHGRVVRVNDSFLDDYGWTREEILGEEFSVVIPSEDRNISRKLHKAFIERGRHGSRELRIVKKDGQIADAVVTTALLELSHKRRFMVSTIRDTTERRNMMRNLKRAKEDADTANKAKSSFLANMSHELRTPLNAIIGFTELMKNQTFGSINNPKYEEYLSDIYFSARHLLEIINDVLDMSKIEAGRVDLIESEVRMPELFDTVTRIMADRAAAASVEIVTDIKEGLPNIIVDQRLLRQILINLVSNAVKFSSAGSHVTISASLMADKHIRMSVTDQGCGIPVSKIKHVMEPFGQVNDPKYYTGQGTGLGLPLAKAMAELHDAVLSLETEEGKGTKVYIDFPVSRTALKTKRSTKKNEEKN